LITPGLGLVVWMTLAFGVVLWILKKYAWKPILESIHKREETIENALKQAELARAEMEKLQAANEDLLRKAREERDIILKEARDQKDAIINEAKNRTKVEQNRIIEAARETIRNEKLAAITELKNQVATLSLEIAEKVLRAELSNENKQQTVINNLVNEINLN
ncbi:MAG: F0F1 ATP synthase subunit B, partial [Flavobacteriales bacterium]